MRILIAQLNPTIGALEANRAAIAHAYQVGVTQEANLVVAPELALSGYPPRDLLTRPAFVRAQRDALAALVRHTGETALALGAVVSPQGDPLALGQTIANGVVVARGGQIIACGRKQLLPAYDVFDETRYFTPGRAGAVVSLGDRQVGLTVCEDIWNDVDALSPFPYGLRPVRDLAARGIDVLLNVSASPYARSKPHDRHALLEALAQRHRLPILYVNQVGGNDGLLFDGRSLAVSAEGQVVAGAPAYTTEHILVELEGQTWLGPNAASTSSDTDVCGALEMGLRDYVHKCGARDVCVGLSGGIDSALVAALAVRALGPTHVRGYGLPSRYSSEGSVSDARTLAQRLGIRFDVVPIEDAFVANLAALAALFPGRTPSLTDENIQARIRGALLMGITNETGALLLATSNKSEIAVGYSTLYGDSCGAIAPIGDLYKTEVYDLARHINAVDPSQPIPEATLTKPPSAELRPEQKDSDSLPEYAMLDPILRGYIEGALSVEELVAGGADARLVARVASLVDRAEYKRWQMPPPLRVSSKAFGVGRRMPVARGW